VFLSASGRACPAPTPHFCRGEACLDLAPHAPRSRERNDAVGVLAVRKGSLPGEKALTFLESLADLPIAALAPTTKPAGRRLSVLTGRPRAKRPPTADAGDAGRAMVKSLCG
jgi:hypothetical protein